MEMSPSDESSSVSEYGSSARDEIEDKATVGRDKITVGNISDSNYVVVGSGQIVVYPEINESPPLWVGVPSKPTIFLGRDSLIHDLLHRGISSSSGKISLVGMPGVGKTSIASSLAYTPKLRGHFTGGVLWASLGKESDVFSIQDRWAAALNGDITDSTDPWERKQLLSNTLGQRSVLIVIDDVWEEEAAEQLCVGGPDCLHIFTTRFNDVAASLAAPSAVVQVPTLDDDSAYAMLNSLATVVCMRHPNEVRTLLSKIGGLPLAISLLGGYLSQTRRSIRPRLSEKALKDMSDPTERLNQAQFRIGSVNGRKETLKETINLSLEWLNELKGGDEAVGAFYSIGAFAPKPASFSWEAATSVAACDEDTIAWLIEVNLLEENADRLAIHQTLANVANASLPEKAIERHRAFYLDLAKSHRDDWQTILAAHEQIQQAWRFVSDGEAVLDFIWALRRFHQLRGLRDHQLEWYQRGLSVAQGMNHKLAEGTLLRYLGLVHSSLDNPTQAIEYLNQSLQVFQGLEHKPGIASNFTAIGWVHYPERLSEVLDYFQRALSIYEDLHDKVGVSASLNSIGRVYRALGHEYWPQALEYYEKALTLNRELGNLQGMAFPLTNIGAIYGDLGNKKEALDYLKEALSIRVKIGDIRGESVTRQVIAFTYATAGNFVEAAKAMSKAATLAEQAHNTDLDHMLECLSSYNAILAKQQQS